MAAMTCLHQLNMKRTIFTEGGGGGGTARDSGGDILGS